MPIASTTNDERLDATFAALANATRRAILARLAEGDANVNELAEPFAMSLPAVSKHIKVLEAAGLVQRTRQAQFRPCSLDAAPLAAVSTWAEQYRPVWEARFDRMDDYLQLVRHEREQAADDQDPSEHGPGPRRSDQGRQDPQETNHEGQDHDEPSD